MVARIETVRWSSKSGAKKQNTFVHRECSSDEFLCFNRAVQKVVNY